jgi:hypothetical protein
MIAPDYMFETLDILLIVKGFVLDFIGDESIDQCFATCLPNGLIR